MPGRAYARGVRRTARGVGARRTREVNVAQERAAHGDGRQLDGGEADGAGQVQRAERVRAGAAQRVAVELQLARVQALQHLQPVTPLELQPPHARAALYDQRGERIHGEQDE